MKEPLVKRAVEFDFSNIDPFNWTRQGKFATHAANALSALFPEAERILIDILRAYRPTLDPIRDKAILDDVSAFIFQEANHAKWHVAFNKMLTASGLPVEKSAKPWKFFLEQIKKLPLSWQASIFSGFEHTTYIFGEIGLEKNSSIFTAQDQAKQFFFWHCLEEIEHRSVCFDVNKRINGNRRFYYLHRQAGFFIIAIIFGMCYLYSMCLLYLNSPSAKSSETLTFVRANRVGAWRATKHWMGYLSPRFHPSKTVHWWKMRLYKNTVFPYSD